MIYSYTSLAEDEDFEPSLGKGIGGTDKWEGEDEDDDSIKVYEICVN